MFFFEGNRGPSRWEGEDGYRGGHVSAQALMRGASPARESSGEPPHSRGHTALPPVRA
ncbi:MAG: hypothetical protein FWH21_02350 [Kiritimatiellaeota bacterium]|nr:hypothetical protein [Kiritimatiellota bacterium]